MSRKHPKPHARPKGAWVLQTIGQMRDDGYFLLLCCHRCPKTIKRDLVKLCEERGDDYPIDLVRRKAKCSVCGARGKDVSIRIGYRGYNAMEHQTPARR